MVSASESSSRVPPRTALLAAAGILIAIAVAFVVAFARRHASDPARCPQPTMPFGPRCCLPGQTLGQGACAGAVTQCPARFQLVAGSCVAQSRRVRIAAGRLQIGPGDWEAQGLVAPRIIDIEAAFWIDSDEVTASRWDACVAAGSCRPLEASGEPGQPVRAVTLAEARGFCAWASGRLARDDEWLLAAAGATGRRYSWGETGAVCQRACWGLSRGPCAFGGSGPDLAGMHADDVTPEGVYDLSGGVAEWVNGVDTALSRGGSFRSSFAAELRTWHAVERDPQGRFDDVGFRCSYSEDSTTQPPPRNGL